MSGRTGLIHIIAKLGFGYGLKAGGEALQIDKELRHNSIIDICASVARHLHSRLFICHCGGDSIELHAAMEPQ